GAVPHAVFHFVNLPPDTDELGLVYRTETYADGPRVIVCFGRERLDRVDGGSLRIQAGRGTQCERERCSFLGKINFHFVGFKYAVSTAKVKPVFGEGRPIVSLRRVISWTTGRYLRLSIRFFQSPVRSYGRP